MDADAASVYKFLEMHCSHVSRGVALCIVSPFLIQELSFIQVKVKLGERYAELSKSNRHSNRKGKRTNSKAINTIPKKSANKKVLMRAHQLPLKLHTRGKGGRESERCKKKGGGILNKEPDSQLMVDFLDN